MEDYHKIVFPGHDQALEQMNSQNSLSPMPRKYCFDGYLEREFSSGMLPLTDCLCSRGGPVPTYIEVAVSGLGEFRKEHMELGRKKVGVHKGSWRGQTSGALDQTIVCACTKFSNHKLFKNSSLIAIEFYH